MGELKGYLLQFYLTPFTFLAGWPVLGVWGPGSAGSFLTVWGTPRPAILGRSNYKGLSLLTFKMEGVPSVLTGSVCQSTGWTLLDLCQGQRPLSL